MGVREHKGFKERPGLVEPAHYLEEKVRFSFSACNTRDYCIKNLERNELKDFYGRMGELEQLTWKQVRQIRREKGFSIDSSSEKKLRNLLETQKPGLTYGHFRVTGSNRLIRIFIGLNRDLANVLLVDAGGRLQHN